MSQAYCTVVVVSLMEFFSPMGGFYRERGESGWHTGSPAFQKPLICPLDLCFFRALLRLLMPLWWSRITLCIISHIERSALSLRLSLNHQQYPENLFIHPKLRCIFTFFTHMHLSSAKEEDMSLRTRQLNIYVKDSDLTIIHFNY